MAKDEAGFSCCTPLVLEDLCQRYWERSKSGYSEVCGGSKPGSVRLGMGFGDGIGGFLLLTMWRSEPQMQEVVMRTMTWGEERGVSGCGESRDMGMRTSSGCSSLGSGISLTETLKGPLS